MKSKLGVILINIILCALVLWITIWWATRTYQLDSEGDLIIFEMVGIIITGIVGLASAIGIPWLLWSYLD